MSEFYIIFLKNDRKIMRNDVLNGGWRRGWFEQKWIRVCLIGSMFWIKSGGHLFCFILICVAAVRPGGLRYHVAAFRLGGQFSFDHGRALSSLGSTCGVLTTNGCNGRRSCPHYAARRHEAERLGTGSFGAHLDGVSLHGGTHFLFDSN